MGDDLRDSFSGACGLAGPLKVRLEGPEADDASLIEFRQPYLVVGRDRRADVMIDGKDVSRRHAYFQVVAGRVFCVDLGSRTGVRWADGARPVGWVDPGQDVGIGPTRVRFEGGKEGQGGNLPISRSFESPSLPDVGLEFLNKGAGRETWQVSRALVLIGRSPTCRVQLLGPGVGSIHAAIVRTPTGVWVVDLLGPGGMLIAGTRARSGRLEDGDEIGVGGHRIRVRIGEAARPSGRTELARSTSSRAIRRPLEGGGPPASPLSRVEDQAGAGRDMAAPPDAATARLLDEFDRMHQRTTEQFQQAILMMFRMHQDQMEVIRDELSRLDRLEDEQRSLRDEMSRGNPSRSPRVALRLVRGGPAASPPSLDGPVPAEPSHEPGGACGGGPPVAHAPSVRARGEDDPPGAGRQAEEQLPPPSDPHARLARRLSEIQDERQGLWKKILGSLTGGETERILP